MPTIIYMLCGAIAGLCVSIIMNLNLHDSNQKQSFDELQQEHIQIVNEIRETKAIAKENGKKLDFLVDAYRQSLNQDTLSR